MTKSGPVHQSSHTTPKSSGTATAITAHGLALAKWVRALCGMAAARQCGRAGPRVQASRFAAGATYAVLRSDGCVTLRPVNHAALRMATSAALGSDGATARRGRTRGGRARPAGGGGLSE